MAFLDRLVDPLRDPAMRRGLSPPVDPPERLLAALAEHQLESLWLDAAGEVPEAVRVALSGRRAAAAAQVMLQAHSARRLTARLEAEGVPSVVFKGLHLGHVLYGDPVLRAGYGVDVLVPLESRPDAVAVAEALGWRSRPDPTTSSHEMTFEDGPVRVDLHWALFRPGRTRRELGPEIVASRVAGEGMFFPDDLHALMILLLHPAVTKHVTQGLVRALDVDRWIRRRPPDWDALVPLLRSTGLSTAAWVMLEWTRRWFDTPLPREVERALAPGALRRRYLRAWLARDPGAEYWRRPNLVRAGFSLVLQDSLPDVVRAVWQRAGGQGGAE